MNTPQRIIDANANRAREALRVLEEAARFIADDADLSLRLKQMRHDLAHALPDPAGLIHHRDTPGDVGTSNTTTQEMTRKSVGDVVLASGARLSEALRAIEEYAKVEKSELEKNGDSSTRAPLAGTAERLRYESYDLTQQLVRALGSGKAEQWRLCLLLTESLCREHPWQRVLEQAVEHGADCVQVREKAMDAGPLLERVREVMAIVKGKAAVIVNDRPDIALLAGARGVHLGQTDLSPRAVRELAGNRLVIGVSTANLEQARRARAEGADYCGVGPMFVTTTKHKPDLAGPAYLRAYRAWGGLPHLAIGGISPVNIAALVQAGAQGVAVSSAICSATNPGGVTREMVKALGAAATRQK